MGKTKSDWMWHEDNKSGCHGSLMAPSSSYRRKWSAAMSGYPQNWCVHSALGMELWLKCLQIKEISQISHGTNLKLFINWIFAIWYDPNLNIDAVHLRVSSRETQHAPHNWHWMVTVDLSLWNKQWGVACGNIGVDTINFGVYLASKKVLLWIAMSSPHTVYLPLCNMWASDLDASFMLCKSQGRIPSGTRPTGTVMCKPKWCSLSCCNFQNTLTRYVGTVGESTCGM